MGYEPSIFNAKLLVELQTRRKQANERLEGLNAREREPLAFKAVQGDANARKALDELDQKIAAAERDVRDLTDAIAFASQSNVAERERRKQERERAGRKKQAPVMLHQLADSKAQLEATIKRFEDTGQEHQAAIWRRELETLEDEIKGWEKELAA
jgi:archaellum component FlaC